MAQKTGLDFMPQDVVIDRDRPILNQQRLRFSYRGGENKKDY